MTFYNKLVSVVDDYYCDAHNCTEVNICIHQTISYFLLATKSLPPPPTFISA